ncbi:MAG: anaerobic ribonucleoside-triphosphate reductase activating protein [Lachnospiraceae bacterium]|nr:anaerobic ribonucleoside-triphosphate reductase activating protein [Lachnospiraceae bacterium]
MSIHGLNKLTLLDFPGKVAATIFLGGCNFRCPFCQNSELVLDPYSQPVIPTEDILAYLKKRQGLLDGVCISGGEPTLYNELIPLIRQIKEFGYLVKLDTNGFRPAVVKNLVEEGLIDMIAMDIKSSPEHYALVAGVPTLDLVPIQQTVTYLLEGHVPYEFRTTVVKELHSEEDFRSIGQWIGGCSAYYLQAYKDSPEVMKPGFSSYTRAELEIFRQLLSETIPKVEIRGID